MAGFGLPISGPGNDNDNNNDNNNNGWHRQRPAAVAARKGGWSMSFAGVETSEAPRPESEARSPGPSVCLIKPSLSCRCWLMRICGRLLESHNYRACNVEQLSGYFALLDERAAQTHSIGVKPKSPKGVVR